ncbi:MAG: hypothetical protein WC231_03160 [Dehalococcoidales bacterium]|jgi:TRAP-type C4-dicarboxylate transport system permease large subunit
MESYRKAEEALVKKVVKKITQSEWTIYVLIVLLSLIFGTAMLTVALTQGL